MKWVARVLAVVVVAVVAYLALQERGRSDLNNEGVRLLNEGKYEEAARLFEQALEGEPSNETIKRNLAKAREGIGAADSPGDGGAASDEALLERAAKRVARMKAEGWKKEEGVTLKDLLDTVKVTRDMGNSEQEKTVLERALFLDPTNVDTERRIEQLEQQSGS